MKGKRLISILLILALAGSLAACSGQTTEVSKNTEEPAAEAVAEEQAAAEMTRSFDGQSKASDREIMLPQSSENMPSTKGSASQVADETVTVMVYMVGSTLESNGSAASNDLDEIVISGVDTSRCNVLVFTGGSTRWDSNVPSKCNSIYLLEGYNQLYSIYTTDSMWNMGEENTLATFLRYGYTYYPADHYALILWDHGGGPIYGFGDDENYGGDRLEPAELEEALEESPFGGDVRFDWVGYDACVMESIETAALWTDYADYLIASEESEAKYGWDYSFLSVLNETVDPAQIGTAVVDTFADFYKNGVEDMESETLSYPDYTLSCLDLSKVSDVLDSLDALSNAMARDVSKGYDIYQLFANVRKEVPRFGVEASSSLELVDLGDLADRMESLYPHLAADLSESVSELIVYNRSNIKGANGVSIYYPYEYKAGFLDNEAKIYETLDMPESYLEYLTAFSNYWAQEGTYDSMETEEEESFTENELVIQLSDEQLSTLSSATYTVMIDVSSVLGEPDGSGLYAPVMLNHSVEPDENGQLHIPNNVELMFFAEAQTTPCIVQQIDETDSYVDYITLESYLGGGTMFSYNDKIPVQIRVRVYKKDGSAEIISVCTVDDENGNTGKSDISLADFNSLGCYYTGYKGQDYVPYTQWEASDLSKGVTEEFSGTFQGTWGTSATAVYPVVCQVLLEDVRGGVSASKLLELNWNDRESIAVSTKNGEMTFANTGNSVILTSYIGTDTKLDIPEKVNGLPVEKIDNKAFYQNDTLQSVSIPGTVSQIRWKAFYECENLETVVLHEGLEKIVEGAFTNCENLTTINIPASVTEIGLAVFAGCWSLTDLTVSSRNQNYRMQDGLILSADGKTLVSYTAAVGSSVIRVPDGVTKIADGAFAYCLDAEEIILPDGLKRIGNYAFFMCAWLQAPEFPDSLTSIGSYAFNMGDYELKYNAAREELELPDPMPVTIGANLMSVNATAFSDDIYSKFVVSSANPYYSSVDGDLANKAGDFLICRAYREEDSTMTGKNMQYEGMEFVVPSGYDYEVDEDGASFTLYDSGEFAEEVYIMTSTAAKGQTLTGTDRDFELMESVFDNFIEGFDFVDFKQSEITIDGYDALCYIGSAILDSEEFEYNLALVCNPKDQHLYIILRDYYPDKTHMLGSEFQRLLGSISFSETSDRSSLPSYANP